MRTVVLSDLHLGTASGRDLLRRRRVRAALAAALADADRVVLLGDVLELRDSPLAAVKRRAEPILRELGEAVAGAEVIVCPGNHDHRIFGEWAQHRRLGPGPAPIALEQRVEPGEPEGGLLDWLAEALDSSRLQMSYPGVRLRPDVWATHGHYLDAHNAVPAFEAVAAQAAARATGRLRPGRHADPDAYESVLGPLYASLYARAQRGSSADPEPRPAADGTSLSLRVLRRIQEPRGRFDPAHLMLARVLLPAAVRGANLAGLGRFSSDLSGPQLRRAGLTALAEVVSRLGVEARHVVFGHTHRRGPLDGDELSEWRTAGGAELHNCGSWVSEPWLVGDAGRASPYWPGSVLVVENDGPPRLDELLEAPLAELTA